MLFRSYTSFRKAPQVFGFKVDNDAYKSAGLSPRKTAKSSRRGQQMPLGFKRLIGIVLIIIGCILLLTQCFGRKSKTKDEEAGAYITPQTITAVSGTEAAPQNIVGETNSIAEGAVTAGVEATPDSLEDALQVIQRDIASEPFNTYIQDFDIDADTIYQLSKYANRHQIEFAHALAVWALESYRGTEASEIYKIIAKGSAGLELDSFGLYKDALELYRQFMYDIESFPIKNKSSYNYENGWKEKRTYNGDRLHYGIDVMSNKNKAGVIPILSMTSGTIENLGWNQTGGYRVGIRSESGAYFYYAHLDSIPDFLAKGDLIAAGDFIGYMGDTGYGEEGTRGEFPVHLHVGIAVSTDDNKEYWINPYNVLKYLEKYGR